MVSTFKRYLNRKIVIGKKQKEIILSRFDSGVVTCVYFMEIRILKQKKTRINTQHRTEGDSHLFAIS